MSTSLTIGELKARLPEALALVKKGETVSVTYGRSKRPVAVLSPPAPSRKRKLGMFADKLKIKVSSDWEMTNEEFLNS